MDNNNNNRSLDAEKSESNGLENISKSNIVNSSSINNVLSPDSILEIKNILSQCVTDGKKGWHFICKKCKSIFLLVLIKNYYFLKCNCKQTNFTQSKNDENIIKNIKNEIESDNQLEDDSIFITFSLYTSYCRHCNIDLDGSNKNDHIEHKEKVIDYKKLITDDDKEIIRELNENNNKRYEKLNKDGRLKEIIELIINDFELFKCYNLIQSIKNIIDYFNIKVNSITELEEFIEQAKSNKESENIYDKDFSDIRIIHLEGSDHNNILEKLCCNELKDKLGNITQLKLKNCNLNHFQPLLNVDLPNLETLHLVSNKLGNEIINRKVRIVNHTYREIIFLQEYFKHYFFNI